MGPNFCDKLTYTPEHAEMVNEFIGKEEEEGEEEKPEQEGNEEKKEKIEKQSKDPMKVIQKLRERSDEASTEFLAAICYHHYHGHLEDAAFDALKARAKDNEHVSGILILSL